MKNARSKYMLSLVSERTLNKTNSAMSESTAVNNENMDIPETGTGNHEVLATSPVPEGAENIQKDLSEVWEDVFGSTDDKVTDNQPPQLCLVQNNVSANATDASSSVPVAENSLTDNQHFSHMLDNNHDLTPFALEAPSSFQNSPAISFSDLPSIPTHNINSTPMPSPLNTHKNCHDAFCPTHDDGPWTMSPSTSNAYSPPNYYNDDEVSTPPKKRSKKRLRRTSEWSDVKRKYLKNIGQKYVTKKGKVVDDKILGAPCKCRYRCFEKITHDQRYACFQKFWRLGNREKQWAFVVKYSKKLLKNRCLNREVPNNRKFTFKYFLPVIPEHEQGHSEVVNVCKTMFLNSLSVSGKIIKTSWDKYDGSIIIEEDKRGRHTNHNQIIKPDTIKSVCDHVRSFAPVESHYIRKNSTKLYLDGSLNISKMFKLYKDWFDNSDNIYSSKAVTERQYRDIVNKNFNLGFFIPKKDQCDVCHIFRNKSDPTDQEREVYNTHLSNKNEARKLKNIDKRDAVESNGQILTAVFDFQKVLSCPHGQVSLFYYKRKLSCLDFTIFDMGGKKAYCYMWDETVAKRGANEVGSCLLDFIDQNARNGVKEFRFWSDNCAGQNRNRFVFFLYTYCAKKFNVSIKHRFLEKGHTQNEGDSVHALIEREAANTTIYTPDEWRLLVRWAKSTGKPYEVRNMTRNNFFDLKSYVNNKIWSKNTEGVKVTWNCVKQVFVDKSEPNKLLYKCEHTGTEYKTVTISSNTRRNAVSSLPTLEIAYKIPLKLSKDKHKDLISLVNLGIIPSQYADFFRSLPWNNNENNDIVSSDSEE
ncbi:unnamed protein product [Spodoptera littoralis]|uniref:DUF7869 domain-containing protein n=1 Tax=Spodoptera littoralis TaxID=7109 RepID=A0A9P0I8I4_SPOLI|nr:unnamed protein product [Spodoptera littoralis]CAH1640749.1 unnamed protein product [Spodoptera littoralis]